MSLFGGNNSLIPCDTKETFHPSFNKSNSHENEPSRLSPTSSQRRRHCGGGGSVMSLNKMPIDLMLKYFRNFTIGDLEDYCNSNDIGYAQCFWAFNSGIFVTRVAIDFCVWTIDDDQNPDLEATETAIIRIHWKSLNELLFKISVIKHLLQINHSTLSSQFIPFAFHEITLDDPELLDDPASNINKNTLFSDLFNTVWTIGKFDKFIDLYDMPQSYNADQELNLLRSKWKLDVEWPAVDTTQKLVINNNTKVFLNEIQTLLDKNKLKEKFKYPHIIFN